MSSIAFTKMHGLGNDFVVLDGRARPLAIGATEARAIADRRTGVGCDQVLILEPATNGTADLFMRIRNSDGGEVEACGNGTRCVAALVMGETDANYVRIETMAGVLEAQTAQSGLVSVDMGPVSTDWRQIPLAWKVDTLHLSIGAGVLSDPVAVNVGNPHAVFFVDDVEAVPLADLGPELEHHDLYPERTNVEAAQIIGDGRIRLRVWERGAGITRACGSGACATAVAAHLRGLTGRRVEVMLDGGLLTIEWQDDNRVMMTGPAAISFSGLLNPVLLSGATEAAL